MLDIVVTAWATQMQAAIILDRALGLGGELERPKPKNTHRKDAKDAHS